MARRRGWRRNSAKRCSKCSEKRYQARQMFPPYSSATFWCVFCLQSERQMLPKTFFGKFNTRIQHYTMIQSTMLTRRSCEPFKMCMQAAKMISKDNFLQLVALHPSSHQDMSSTVSLGRWHLFCTGSIQAHCHHWMASRAHAGASLLSSVVRCKLFLAAQKRPILINGFAFQMQGAHENGLFLNIYRASRMFYDSGLTKKTTPFAKDPQCDQVVLLGHSTV